MRAVVLLAPKGVEISEIPPTASTLASGSKEYLVLGLGPRHIRHSDVVRVLLEDLLEGGDEADG